MKKNITLFFFSLLLGFSLLNAKERKVFFIGIDGVRSDALIKANTPVMDSIFKTGFHTYTSWHIGITVSAPSWSSMLCGVWEPKHGVTSNAYTNSKYDRYPYFTTRAKEYRPDLYTVQITSWAPMSDKVYNDGWNEKIIVNSDDAVIEAAKVALKNPDLDVLFTHIDDADAVGHGNGFNPNLPIYISQLEYIDKQVGELIAALKARPNYEEEDWLILFTTDHGGIGTGHGGITREEKRIWWAASGSTVDTGLIEINVNDVTQWFKAPMLVDIGVTALDHLLPDVDPTKVVEWNLEGKSWLSQRAATPVREQVIDAQQFKIYPNPANDWVRIESPATSVEWIRILDTKGAIIKELKGTVNRLVYEIPTGDLTPAAYIIQIRTQEGLASRAFVKF